MALNVTQYFYKTLIKCSIHVVLQRQTISVQKLKLFYIQCFNEYWGQIGDCCAQTQIHLIDHTKLQKTVSFEPVILVFQKCNFT